MRWGQVVALWAVCAALAAEYWWVERPTITAKETRTERRRFLAVEPSAVHELRLVRDGRRVVVRRAGAGWAVVEPADSAIAPDLVTAFMNALMAAEEIAQVAGPEADPHVYGLDERAGRIEIVADPGTPVEVRIGSENPTGTAVYARRSGSTDVVLIGRNVRYYEDLIFQGLPPPRVPGDAAAPVGG
ncbi:MAG TPA: DUF4340 domain-containing protein [Candidatus Binatia bacterium]|nr:DUF4340 domain-containing protein [Candidatus Binatia bacterium]